jgi:hypothetical protein
MSEARDHLFEEWNLNSAERAFLALSHYVDHAQVSGLVIALLAGQLGEEKLKPLLESDYWRDYQESRHGLIECRYDVERLGQLIDRMREKENTKD